jgi:protoporphyrinogen oxidase
MKMGILGGGITGLTIANFLRHDYEVLEKNNECGGLCRSIKDRGFTFDYGPHVIYSGNKKNIDFILKLLNGNYEKIKRNNKIFLNGKYIKYPFENGLSELGKEEAMRCLKDYVEQYFLREGGEAKKPKNFKDWIIYRFGKRIADIYMIPYNEKVWSTKAEKMAFDWAEERVPQPPIMDVVKSAIGIETEGYLIQLYYHYPKKGGIQAIIRALEKGARNITTNFGVKKIRKKGTKWLVSDSKKKEEFDKLVSTIPLPELIDMLEKVPEKVKTAAHRLRFNSLIFVMIGLDSGKPNDFSAIYFPEREIKCHRVGFPPYFSKNTVPRGKYAVEAEITATEGDDTWKMSDEKIIANIVNGLHQRKIIDKKKVCYKKVERYKYAYVVFGLEHNKNIRIVKDYLKKIGIEICGRFGEFEYLNMDKCIERAHAMAEKLNKVRQ